MGLSKKEIEHVALLSRLELSDAMAGKMAAQLSQVLDYINKLNELDTTGIEAMSHPGALLNVFREDSPAGSLDPESALKNAPGQADGFFRVPRVIE